MENELEKMYFNYITNLINYFEIKDITGFRKSIANLVNNQPDPTNEESMSKWSADFSGTILTFSTLSEEELQKRFKKELVEMSVLANNLQES